MVGVFPVGEGSPLGGGLASSREPKRWETGGSHVLRGSPPSCFWFFACLASAKETEWDSRPKDTGWGLSGARVCKMAELWLRRELRHGCELRGLSPFSGENVAGCSDRK